MNWKVTSLLVMDKQGKAKVVCYIHGPPASYVTHPLTYFMCDDDHSI